MQSFLSWTHILFFATWFGANLFCLAIFLPASTSLPHEARWQARYRASRALNGLVCVSAPLVLLSGFAWLTLPELGDGSFRWHTHSFILAAKVTLTVAMIMNHLLQAFRYAPPRAPDPELSAAAAHQAQSAWRVWVRLLGANVVLGFAVFLLGLALV